LFSVRKFISKNVTDYFVLVTGHFTSVVHNQCRLNVWPEQISSVNRF